MIQYLYCATVHLVHCNTNTLQIQHKYTDVIYYTNEVSKDTIAVLCQCISTLLFVPGRREFLSAAVIPTSPKIHSLVLSSLSHFLFCFHQRRTKGFSTVHGSGAPGAPNTPKMGVLGAPGAPGAPKP